MDEQIITLLDEEDKEHEFVILEVLEIDGFRYAILLPYEAPEEGVVVLRMDKDRDGKNVLVGIDPEESEKVQKVLDSLDEDE
jgi:uncharacterized protein YrzB (UPF0473 family)